METALWVPVADAEPHGIYSNVTAWASWESQCLTVTPFFEAWLFLNVVQHPQDWIWFVKPMSCMVALLLSSSFSPHVSFSPREKKRQVSDVSGEGRRGLLGAGQPRGTALSAPLEEGAHEPSRVEGRGAARCSRRVFCLWLSWLNTSLYFPSPVPKNTLLVHHRTDLSVFSVASWIWTLITGEKPYELSELWK